VSLIINGQIIADHTIVDRFDDIPAAYITEIKKMWVTVPGESHSQAYRDGLALLASLYPAYAAVADDGGVEEYTDKHLRINRATWGDYSNSSGWIHTYGEEDWFTNSTAIERTKAGITYCNTHNLTIAAMGFGWCSDMTFGTPSATTDPVYGVHWYGSSVNGPDGDRCWGLDNADSSLTGNSVNMDTYLNATQQYIDYCTANGYPTKVFFTTGPVDATYWWYGEAGYQGHIKHEYIRDYVSADATRILFDYADILCYNDDGSTNTLTWNGHTYPAITATNLGEANTGHIGSAGAIRLAKAMWWMLARIAGWDGGTISIPVTSIIISGSGGDTTIATDKGTLQLNAAITPDNATNKTVTWSVTNGTGQATINSSGLVTALVNGTVTALATANDGSGVYGTLVITITNQVILVTGITVAGARGATLISVLGGTLQLSASITPTNATNQAVTWSVTNGTGQATINSTGLVTAVANGTVTARATANDGSGIYATLVITISNQIIPVMGITLTGAGGVTTIITDNGTLQLSAAITPTNASNQAVTWSVTDGTGQATINSTGLVTAVANGTVTARATANDGSGVYGTLMITISTQIIPVTEITVMCVGGATSITTDNGTLQLSTTVLPANATNKAVTWSISSGTDKAFISSAGLVTATDNGTITARAIANDGSGVFGTLLIVISNQVIPVTAIKVIGADRASLITTVGGSLQLSATIIPVSATNQAVTWSITNGTGQASIDATGLVTAISSGIVIARALANDGSGVTATTVITIKRNIDDFLIANVDHDELKFRMDENYFDCKISIYDLHGNIIATKLVDSNLCVFNVASIGPGLYIAVLSNSMIHKVAKVIIP
jgi:uncharacterized protein YjdB